MLSVRPLRITGRLYAYLNTQKHLVSSCETTHAHTKIQPKVFKSCELHVLVCLSECEYEQKHERNSVQIVMKVPENNHFIFPFIRSDFILLVVAEVRLQHIDYIHCPIIDPLFCL